MRIRHKLVADERGMMLVMAGFGLIAFMAASMLALDVGMMMTARSQAQNAADAGALAGAIALYYNDWDDRSAAGPAKKNAIAAATADDNHVINTNVVVTPDDVTFPTADRVRVVVHRTAEHDNALVPLIASSLFGLEGVDVKAEAIARAAPANAMTCVKPFTIPDKWIEKQTPPWDPTDTFDIVDNKGNPLPDPDVYYPAKHPSYTGYSKADFGTRVVIKEATGTTIAPSIYFPYSMGGVTGASEYEWNVANCNTTLMGYGDKLLAEPGGMTGPTKAGVEELIARDPDAYWNGERIVSDYSPSPRVAPIPVFDPVVYDTGKRTGRGADFQVANYIGIFIEKMVGKNVYGVIVPVGGVVDGDRPEAPESAVPRAIVLVK